MNSNPAGRLAGKVAVITGAASGIGAASARRFVAEGARVVAVDIDPAGEQVAADACGLATTAGSAEGRDQAPCLFLQGDVTRAADVQASVDLAERAFGRLDVMFSNAGAAFAGTILETDEATFDRLVAVNLKAAYHCARAAIPAFRRAGGGVLLTTASGAGLVPRSGLSVYAATKAGVVMLTKSLALEYARDGIRAVAICPGIIDTPMPRAMERLYPDPATARRETEQLYPLGRYGTADEVANLALFLASDEASYITGIAAPVDGGRTLH